MLGWFANLFMWVGLWRIGYKDRRAFVLLVIGDMLWVIYFLQREQYSALASYAVFTFFSCKNWLMWGKEVKVDNGPVDFEIFKD